MNFEKTLDNTWIISDISEMRMVGFDKDNHPYFVQEAFLDIDLLDGSFYDSDGVEKKLLLKFENNLLSFETLPEDHSFWENTENCYKQGCLGYVADLLNELQKDNDYEYELTPQNNLNEDKEFFLWPLEYIKKNYPEIITPKTSQLKP